MPRREPPREARGIDRARGGDGSPLLRRQWESERLIFLDVAENEVDHVLLTVMHKNLGGGADQTLGQCICHLRTAVLSPGIETVDSLDLAPAPGQTTPCSGSLRVEMAHAAPSSTRRDVF